MPYSEFYKLYQQFRNLIIEKSLYSESESDFDTWLEILFEEDGIQIGFTDENDDWNLLEDMLASELQI